MVGCVGGAGAGYGEDEADGLPPAYEGNKVLAMCHGPVTSSRVVPREHQQLRLWVQMKRHDAVHPLDEAANDADDR